MNTRFAFPNILPRFRPGFLAAWLYWFLLPLPGMAVDEAGRTGKPMTPPDTEVIAQTPNYLFTADPTVRGGERGVFVLRFETATPTLPARLYYGSFLPDQETPLPRYRQFASEDGDAPTTAHSIEVDVTRLERPVVDAAGLGPNGGGIVCYRIEVFWEETPQGSRRNTSVFYDGRFAYRREGEMASPDSRYERIACVVEGPFVDQVAQTRAVVSWRSDLPVPGSVVFDDRKVFSPTLTTWHEVTVDGLRPGSKYAYTVAPNGGQASPSFTFETQGVTEDRFTFAFMSDSREGVGGGEAAYGGVNLRIIREFALDAYRRGARFYLFGGDLVNGYTTSEVDMRMQLRAWKTAWEPVGGHRSIFECPGNHEALLNVRQPPESGLGPDGTAAVSRRIYFNKRDGLPDPYIPGRIQKSMETVFSEEFVNPENGPAHGESSLGPLAPPYRENVYYFDWGNSRFIAFNNNYAYCSLPEDFGGNLEGYVLDEAVEWLKGVLDDAASNRRIRHVFLFAQEPIFPNGGHLSDAMWYNGGAPSPTGWDRSYVIRQRNRLWSMIASNPKCIAFLAGDEHNYSRTLITAETPVNPDGSADKAFEFPVWHLTSGGCGAPYYAQQETPWTRDVFKFSAQQQYLLIHVDGDRVRLETIGIGGIPVDAAELR